MLYGWDDEVWKVFITGGYGFLTAAFAAWLTFKLNQVARRQLINSGKIDDAAIQASNAAKNAKAAAEKAEEARKVALEANLAKEEHLSKQDAVLNDIKQQTNGIISEVVRAAVVVAKDAGHKEGHESGEKAALGKMLDQGIIKEHS